MRHLCLAIVPPERVTRLTSLDPASYQWVVARDWHEARDAVRSRPIDLGVIDPMRADDAEVTEVEQLRVQFPSLPLMLYTTLTPAAAAVLLRLGRVGIRRVVFARFEDAAANLRRTIAKELEHAALQQVMRSLDGVLRGLPEALRRSIEVSLHTPTDGMPVDLLAERAHLSRYECEAWFARAGLPAPRVMLTLARLLYAHRLLLDPGHTIDDVAQKLGYAKTRTLQAQLRMVFGMTAGELRHSLSPDAAVEAVMHYYVAPRTYGGARDLVAAQG